MAYVSPTLTLMIGAVKKASSALIRDFNELEHLQSSVNVEEGFARRSYEKAQRILTEELAKIKSGYKIICDADSSSLPHGNCFLLAPIDGYVNFAHANGHFAVSVALIENDAIVAAVISNPISDELFFAEKGSGAFKEGFRSHERLRVSGAKKIENTLIASAGCAELLQKVMQNCPHVIVSGSTALDLAYVAAGKLNAVISEKNNPNNIAAGMLLVKEAGGYIFEIGEKDIRTENLTSVLHSGRIIATNEALRGRLAELTA